MLGKKNAPSVLKQMEHAIKPALFCTFAGRPVVVIVRELNYAQTRACGDFSLIELEQDIINKLDEGKNISLKKMSEYSELQYNIVKAALVNPTYEEILSIVVDPEKIKHIEKELSEIQDLFYEIKDKKEKKSLQEEHIKLEMMYKYVLPADFVAAVMNRALARDKTDIDLVTEKMLIEAANKAKLGKDNPADHLPGNFTDFNREDINSRAWVLYGEEQKKRKNKIGA